MARQDATTTSSPTTSFLYGGNADYIEDLYARYQDDPASVDAGWQDFFDALKDDAARRAQERRRRVLAAAELAVAGQRRAGRRRSTAIGAAVEKRIGEEDQGQGADQGVELSPTPTCMQATRDSVRAIMMIRAYRMRGHLHANLDPLGLASRRATTRSCIRRPMASPRPTTTGRSSSTTCSGSSSPPSARCSRSCERTYCSTLGVEFMHISDPAREGLDPGAHRGPRQGIAFTPRGQARHPQQAGRGRRLREIHRRQIHRHQALRPRRRRIADPGARADHQARRRARRAGDRARHGASRPAQCARAGHGQAAPRHLPRVQGRLRRRPTTSRARATSKYHLGASSDREFDGNKVHLSLTANPSHLEIVDPVVLGKARAKQDQHRRDAESSR